LSRVFSLLRPIQLRSPAALAGCAAGTPAAALGGTATRADAAAGFAREWGPVPRGCTRRRQPRRGGLV